VSCKRNSRLPQLTGAPRVSARITTKITTELLCSIRTATTSKQFAAPRTNVAANLYSLLVTALANGLEPYRYLRFVFEKLPLATELEHFEETSTGWRRSENFKSIGGSPSAYKFSTVNDLR
jgi:IS66 C-terminal element